MSEVRLVVRESEHDWSGTVHGSEADYAIAALSADPMTLAELDVAFGRYHKTVVGHSFFTRRSSGINDDPYDAGLVVIDLVARVVLVDSTYSSPGPSGDVCYHDGHSATDKWLRYRLADDWLFLHDRLSWQSISDERRRERAASPPLDTREVFYGRPLLEFVARETFAAGACDEMTDAEVNDSIRKIHVAWLMTPRDDLGGLCPRDVALARRQQVGWDLQLQQNRWATLDERPPGLDESSFAFRYGGYGTHELVKYYDLVRELLWSSWERLAQVVKNQSAAQGPTAQGPAALTVGDFLTSEVPRLESVRDRWLDTPDPECHGRTPRSIIDRERARLPEGVSGRDAIVDPDCPCCQMMAELPGPAFWHLDGCNMDDDFAFDLYHLTREEWEAEQREWEQRNRRFDAEWEERRRLGVTNSNSGEPGDSVWSSSFSLGDTENVPLGIRLFGIGGHLAELIAAIRTEVDPPSTAPEAQRFIDHLNRDFGNLRELLQNSEPQLAEALIVPVIDRFAATLSEVASVRADLSAKCERLASSLTRFLTPQSSEASWDGGDWEIPF